MKKLKSFFGIILALIILTSCSSDDDGGTNENLIGTWIGVSSTINGKDTGIPDNNIIRFKSDNRVEFIYEGFGIDGENISDFGDWIKDGNTLTIIWDEASPGQTIYTLTILELTKNSLKWSFESNAGPETETFRKI